MQCSKCGTENAPTTKFCAECGAPLRAAQARPTAERRQITVAFVDLVGSTSLSEQHDPEVLSDLISAYQAACAAAIQHYEGHIAQYLGDGILAYFGYPTAHEDDAVRAVQAGLEILHDVELLPWSGDRPQVRIGLHTGLVVVGGGQGREQLALGETPNIAARIQSEAEPDTMLISDATRRLVAGHFALDDYGSRTLKGISRPLQLFRVRGRSRTSRFAAMTVSGLAPFIGREREIDLIKTCWAAAAEGSGRTILFRGEAGIGKSRLLGAARETARERLHEVFEAECSPYHMNNPLYPITEMLNHRLGIESDGPVEQKLGLLEEFVAGRGIAMEEAVPILAALLGIPTDDHYPKIELVAAKQRTRTLEILGDMLRHSPDGVPVLLLIEDLHWADPTTLDLVGSLVARQGNSPLFMVCTTRPEAVLEWLPSTTWHDVTVGALPQADARSLIAGVVGLKPLPDEVLDQIISRTGGIPLFVEAVTRTIIETGVLRETKDRYELTGPLAPGLIPATVHDSLMARIDRLGDDKPIAQLAATMGREFSYELLRSVSGQSDETLRGALKKLLELDLVSVTGVGAESSYTFKHALVQDAAYESLLRKTRQEYHGTIADALMRRYPVMAGTNPELLARHFEGAGRTAEAIAAWMKAGFQAGQRSAIVECVAYLRRALALLETLPAEDPKRIEDETALQLALAPALMAARGWGAREVEVACNRARELCERTQNGQGLLSALWMLWTVLFVRGEHDPALEAAESVLGMALATDNRILHVAARHGVGFTRYFRGEFPAAREHAEKALEIFDLEQEKQLVSLFQIPSTVCCLAFLSQSLHLMGYLDQAKQRHRDLEALVAALANPACTAVGLGVGMYYYHDVHDLDAVAVKAEQGYALSMDEGFVFWVATMRLYRGWVEALRGDATAGFAELRAGFDSYLRTEGGLIAPTMWHMQAEAHLRAGRLDEALAAVDTALRIVNQFEERYFESQIHRLRAEIQLAMNAVSEAEASLRQSIDVAQRQQARLLELRAALVLGPLLHKRGKTGEARDLIQPLHDWFTEGRDAPELVQARSLLASLN